jgi:hypothetical protein
MNSRFGQIVSVSAVVGALAVASAAPIQAAEGRNAAFAAGVAAGVLGGAAVAGAVAPYPAYPAYGPGYAYPAYGPGYYAGPPRYVRPYRRPYRYYYR